MRIAQSLQPKTPAKKLPQILPSANWRLNSASASWRMRRFSRSRGVGTRRFPRPLFAIAFIIYAWKVVVWDKVLGLGTTDALTGDVSQWATIVLTAYFGGRSLEKIVQVLMKK
jgi:hypothetical protein